MATEASPLLGDDSGEVSRAQTSDSSASIVDTSNREYYTSFRNILTHLRKWRTVYIIALIVLVEDIPSYMRLAPAIEALEDRICYDYYHLTSPQLIVTPESPCKLPPIQTRLSNVRGWIRALEILPGLILAFPFGILADTWSRRWVVALGLFGTALGEFWFLLVVSFPKIFPFAAIYAFPFMYCIGGGDYVITAVALAILADAVPIAMRTQIFFLLLAMGMFTQVIAPPIGSFIMDRHGAQVSIAVALIPRVLGIGLLFFIAKNKEVEVMDYVDETEEVAPNVAGPSSALYKLRVRLHGLREYLKQDVFPVLGQPRLLFGMLAMSTISFSSSLFDTLMQYVNLRFKWSYSHAAYLMSFHAALKMLILILVLPFIYAFLIKRFHDPNKANRFLGMWSALFMTCGCLGLVLVQHSSQIFFSLLVYTLGAGFSSSMRSLLTSLVPSKDTAILLTLLSMFDGLGSMAGAPILALALSAGIKAGGILMGLPFFLAAMIYAFSVFCIWCMRLPQALLDEES